ncbi:MAG: class I tRNA ligase family protein, partial [Actinomycetia bacterium]|nr:class I tRNA ligase family protein [Actinomycetes bacterium]
RSADRPLESLNPDRPTTPELSWLDFWADSSAAVYQFIGQDNIYFYGIAQTPLFAGYNSPDNQRLAADPGELQQTRLVANHHLLYFGRKASSSSQYKPPMAAELLNYYTSEQLRAHFVALGLAQKQASFRPKPLNPAAQPGDPDPVLKDGQVLTNVLNRLARSCFYTAQSEQAGRLPLGQPREELQAQAAATLRRYEAAMFGQELHLASQIAADYCRGANKYWSEQSKQSAEPQERRQLLVDCFYLLRVCLLLMHPIAPRGTELVLEYLQLPASPAEFFSWQQVDATGLAASLDIWMSAAERVAGWHALRELPPRTDFFLRHPSQLSGLPAS